MADFTSRFAQWRIRFSAFFFKVLRRGSVKHREADALSKRATNDRHATSLENYILLFTVETNDLSVIPANAADDLRARLFHLLTLSKIFLCSKNNAYCYMIHAEIVHANMKFNSNAHGLLSWRSLVDGALKIPVSPRLLQRILTFQPIHRLRTFRSTPNVYDGTTRISLAPHGHRRQIHCLQMSQLET